jgi:hypothetical protein
MHRVLPLGHSFDRLLEGIVNFGVHSAERFSPRQRAIGEFLHASGRKNAMMLVR